jgi:type I restriction enzyme S subunit
LGDVVQINPRVGTERASADLPVSFVPMAAVCEHTGRIVSSDVRPFGQVSKGFPIFAENDVLFAKITPCMENGKAAIARNLENGTGAGSTEFFVLRPTSRILSEYVFHFIRRTSFRATCKANFTGSAGQQRVPKSFLEKVAIPLPSLDEQRRIVGLLDRAAEIRRRADAARAKARAIIPALFLDTFGDPATNPKGWPETQLSEVLATTLSYGSMTSPRASNDDWLDIRVANIKGGQIDHSDRKYVTLERSLVAKHSLVDGDIVLARAIGSESHLGKCAVAYPGKKRWAYDSHIMRIRVDQNRISPVWLHTLMNTDGGKARLLRQKRASAIQHNINTKEVAIFTFPLPPLPLQTAFAEQVQRLESLARHLDAAAAKAEAMAAGLSAEVFG